MKMLFFARVDVSCNWEEKINWRCLQWLSERLNGRWGRRDTPKGAEPLSLQSGEAIPYHRERFYRISFRPRRTRRQYHDLLRKGQGRIKYQVNEELAGFSKGDIVRVRGKYLKQINSIYSDGRLAFKRVNDPTRERGGLSCALTLFSLSSLSS